MFCSGADADGTWVLRYGVSKDVVGDEGLLSVEIKATLSLLAVVGHFLAVIEPKKESVTIKPRKINREARVGEGGMSMALRTPVATETNDIRLVATVLSPGLPTRTVYHPAAWLHMFASVSVPLWCA